MRAGLVPGHNVDLVDVPAGMAELAKFAPNASAETHYVIQYALQRWARGEEEAARKGACDRHFHGIDYTSWVRVLAAARASAEAKQGATP